VKTGRPGYHPADLLKLYIYGYLNRVRSSRRLEAETKRNLEVMWLLRGLTPDFKTIADFRKDNRDAFKPVFRHFVLLCRKLDLFGGELKQWMNQGAFLMRGLEKARAKFSLTALAYNMTRVLTIVGIERLLKVFKNAKNSVFSTLYSPFAEGKAP